MDLENLKIIHDAITYRKQTKKLTIQSPSELKEIVSMYMEYVVKYNKPFTRTGLALFMGMSHVSLWKFLKKPEYKEIDDLINDIQEQMLIEGGISGKFNPTITKLILSTKHGYSDKVEQNVKDNREPVQVIIKELKIDED